MSDKVKKLAPIIWDEIQKANRILLHCHPSPDADSVGGALAMMHMLKTLGKKVTVISGDSNLYKSLSAIPGFEEIEKKSYLETDSRSFDLFIILDSSSLTQITKKGEVVFPKNLKTVKIDHHQNPDEYADINLIDQSYCATSHILYDLFTEWKKEITPDVAACLFVGIYTDTGGFKYPPTNFETLQAGSELAKIYPDYFKIIFTLENSRTPKQIEFLGLALSSVETYFSNKVAVSFVSFNDLQQRNITRDETQNVELANTLKSVDGWIMSIAALETSKDMMEISLRRREFEGPDLSRLAMALDGGGHKSAAGGRINLPFEEAKKFLLQKIQEVYPELGNP